MIELFLQSRRWPKLNESERAALEQAIARTQSMAANQIIVRENQPLSQCTLLLEGVVQRYKDTGDGKRQILGLHIPGDFVDLHSYPLQRLEHSVGALTAVELAIVPHSAIRALIARSSDLTTLLWRSTLVDAAMNREWLLSVGARSAVGRLAQLFCELFVRMERIGRTEGHSYPLPITQTNIAEATGLTPVHTNRMLRQLRERGLMAFHGGRVTIMNWPGLVATADFDPNYLFLD